MKDKSSLIIGLAAVAALAVGAGAGPSASVWPQWRGPLLNGSNPAAKNLPVHWSRTENVVWRADLPSWSAATPIIWDDSIFVTSAEAGFYQPAHYHPNSGKHGSREGSDDKDKILLLSVRRSDGTVRWSRRLGDGNQIYRKQNLASPSPVTDGRGVWAMTGTGVLRAFDFEGRELWSRDIQQDYGEFGLNHGYASSPLLFENKLYIQVLHGMKTDEPSYLLALDKGTGKTLWKVARPTDAVHESPDAYTTPTLATVGGRRQLVISGGDYVTGHDLSSGKEIWRIGGLNPNRERYYRTIASPMAVGDLVYAAASRGKSFLAIRPGTGLLPSSAIVWKTNLGADVPTAAADSGRIYVVDDKGIVNAFDAATGAAVWNRRRIEPGIYSSSPLAADGKLYATNEDGTTSVISTRGDFEVIAVNRLDSPTMASPIAVGDRLYMRTADALYCIAEK